MFRFLFGMLAMALIAAFVTKPGPEAAEAELRQQLQLAIVNEGLDGKSGLDAAALLLCRTDPRACGDLLMQGIDLTYDDRYLYARVDVKGYKMTATCYGLYTRFFCPGGLVRE
ncbi:hypothetical protein [Mameliella sediminis]|uniref:hypothetical protein n=1 Tax=Mameliella sediminis TaxID=2836866 RepID=UPI001C446B03|nr:hypothetical protein [Mameliella sediminis]MBY6115218.1 hypothetical protein [Antarctobacter heliothermus]MBY6144897.1 hypothetical protein [Mameliella alba]MBV7396012.1 hypothetical protein [Mameliella sediminis]MBY6160423.1 hypothetical protein [Mameliella alba]MBY6168893.1 hypothetical protein [Mameliella alba]